MTALPGAGRSGAVAVVVVVAAVVFAFCCGPGGLGPPDSATVSLRLSRVALGFVVGGALSAVGAALQALLRNPLADPYVLGVSGGAAMGASLFTAMLGAAPSTLMLSVGLPGAGVVGALGASALLVLFVAHDSAVGGRGEGTVLVGIVLNAFSWAVVAVVRALVPASSSAGLSVWLIGSIGYPDTVALIVAGGVTVLGVLALWAVSGSLSILRGGDEEASRLGVDVARVRVVVVCAASALVGVAVGTSGVIGFVGLLVPHAVRRVFTVDERGVIPLSALLGGGLLCAFDGVARLGFGIFGSEIPVGAACALLGAPAFAVLLWRSR
ncbi:MAG: iron ABC transporter permease [Deltaproteobacteria bacterium]|nr:iron ABC transporter permease [Deltaproteobacteria bacterium]